MSSSDKGRLVREKVPSPEPEEKRGFDPRKRSTRTLFPIVYAGWNQMLRVLGDRERFRFVDVNQPKSLQLVAL